MGLSAGTGKLCIFGHLRIVFIWSCFVSCLFLLLFYVSFRKVTKSVLWYSRHESKTYILGRHLIATETFVDQRRRSRSPS